MTIAAALMALALHAPVLSGKGSSCGDSATASGSAFLTEAQCGQSSGDGTDEPSTSSPSSPYSAYKWERLCTAPDTLDENNLAHTCAQSYGCPETLFPATLFGLHGTTWEPLGTACRGAADLADAPPTVTPALVSSAFQKIPLPRLTAVIQPGGKTLVNFDTIFHTDAAPLDRTVTLLGQRVDLAITATGFHWIYGDGSDATTSTPGAAYPSKAIVHRYLRLGTVRPHVDVTWSARWRVNGGAWADVPGTVTTDGPSSDLRVVEATPNLSGIGH
jgi:hypothetical protein